MCFILVLFLLVRVVVVWCCILCLFGVTFCGFVCYLLEFVVCGLCLPSWLTVLLVCCGFWLLYGLCFYCLVLMVAVL